MVLTAPSVVSRLCRTLRREAVRNGTVDLVVVLQRPTATYPPSPGLSPAIIASSRSSTWLHVTPPHLSLSNPVQPYPTLSRPQGPRPHSPPPSALGFPPSPPVKWGQAAAFKVARLWSTSLRNQLAAALDLTFGFNVLLPCSFLTAPSTLSANRLPGVVSKTEQVSSTRLLTYDRDRDRD
ncbi:hypothetical protein E4U42_007649 [Claviceps africana]|uniref:Uncharacterized protein n=1 Tax=Claviceps africana TaxID=83212 RepID=A0A8K0NK05_9HYPO|nr:hypothetical protein E4U42_007649 [Claviceps africana]